MKEMKKAYNNNIYSFECRMDTRSNLTCKIPLPTGNQKCVKAIYWAVSNDVTVTATICRNPNSALTIWEPVKPNAVLSPMVTAMKFDNPTSFYKYVQLWVIME